MRTAAPGTGATDDPVVIQWMTQALRLARLGLYTTDPNPRVGCVIVDTEGVVVGQGWHQRAGGPHAEVHALAEAGSKARGATAYVSLEPCCHHGKTPPCSLALIDAGIAKVVVAMLDPNPLVAGQGVEQLRQAGISVDVGVLEAPARALNAGFIRRMTTARPWVRLKIAMSLDGRTATAAGQSQWITGNAARADVHRLRARSSAILTGIGTVLSDNPSLTARLTSDVPVLQPLRVILDRQLRIPLDAKVLTGPGRAVVYTAVADPEPQQRIKRPNVDVVTVAEGTDPAVPSLDLAAILTHLARHYAVNEVLVEAGATLNGSFVKAHLVDELWCYIAPSLMGSTARGAFALPLSDMSQILPLTPVDIRHLGADLRLRFTLK